MADSNQNHLTRKFNIRYLGRLGQAFVYFCKLVRVFIYQNDWITLPMSALIAGLVSLALGNEFAVNKEGTMLGVFALVCVCLWNGTFNSIQIICREREVIKREHRAGMHISSYVMAHMAFQAIVCMLQVIITLVTASLVGMKISGEGLFTHFLIVDVAITLFLVTYASDVLALFISALVRTTTIAMTIMPFALIFQMVFSGGLFPLPDNITFISRATVSAPGFDALASQMDVNNLSYKSVDGMMKALEETEMDVDIKGSDIINMLTDESNDSIKQLRAIKVGGSMTVREVCNMLLNDRKFAGLRKKPLINRITVGDVLDEISISDNSNIVNLRNTTIEGSASIHDAINRIMTDEEFTDVRNSELIQGISLGEVFSTILALGENVDFVENMLDTQVEGSVNIGELIDYIRNNPSSYFFQNITLLDDTSIGEALKLVMNTNALNDSLNNDLSYYTTVGEVIDFLNNNPAGDEYKNTNIVYHLKFKDVLDKIDKDKLMKIVEESASTDLFKNDYTHSRFNIAVDWLHLIILSFIFFVAAVVSLEFIDKDKR
ncbi:MAG TPA: hypothetical protein DCR12_06205 [Lachnospiraceae bacterium]|nr:hypothetical protein [Lachnospiraceae bacterium]